MGRNSFTARFLARGLAMICMLLFVQSLHAQVNSLGDTPFKSYYITGGHASVGKGLRGSGQGGYATAELSVTVDPNWTTPGNQHTMPPGADILGAWLLWETLEKTQDPSSALVYIQDPCDTAGGALSPPAACSENPAPVNPPDVMYPSGGLAAYGKTLGQPHTASCWSNGGSTGSNNGAPALRSYRLDVLRWLKVSQVTAQRVPAIRVKISDSGGNGNTVPLAEGASLLIVYRRHDLPFRQIYIFNGAATMNQTTDSLFQALPFYKTTSTPNAQLTYIIGDGQSNFPERLWFGTDLSQLAPPAPVFQNNPFNGPNWDDLTYNVTVPTDLPGPFYRAYTKVDHGPGSFDCLSLSAIVFSLELLDGDGDGLAYDWETRGYENIWIAPPWTATPAVLVNLPAMNSASSDSHPDIYIEIDRMKEYLTDSVGSQHEHKVKKDAIDMVCAAFARVGVKAHFDVGTGDDGTGKNYETDPANHPCIIQTGTEGGDVWNERAKPTYCSDVAGDLTNCKYPNQPGVTFWKTGLQFIKQLAVPYDPTQLNYTNVGGPYTGTFKNKDYFNSDTRGPIFHYMLFADALALPALTDSGATISGPSTYGSDNLIPVSSRGQPVPPGSVGILASSTSGRSELPGADSIIALGRWALNTADAQVGNKNLQAATVLHEVAHNLWGYHGGELHEDNCKVTQFSSLNYLYQSAGLLDASGNFKVDLSGVLGPPPAQTFALRANSLNENSLSEFAGVKDGDTAYRLRWYVPRAAVEAYLGIPPNTMTFATRHCDGTILNPQTLPDGHYAGNPDKLVRVDGLGVGNQNSQNLLAGNPVDWNYNGTKTDTSVPNPTGDPPTGFWPDINFNGTNADTPTPGQSQQLNFIPKSDWGHIYAYQGFRQLDSRRSLFGLSVGTTSVDLLLDGEALPGQKDPLTPQILGEVGQGEVGQGEVGQGEVGQGEVGQGEVGQGEVGQGEVGQGPPDEIDEKTAHSVGNAPLGLSFTRTNQAVTLNWSPPSGLDKVISYTVSRVTVNTSTGATSNPIVFPTISIVPPATAPATTLTDATVKNAEAYYYSVVAGFQNGKGSNPATVFVPRR